MCFAKVPCVRCIYARSPQAHLQLVAKQLRTLQGSVPGRSDSRQRRRGAIQLLTQRARLAPRRLKRERQLLAFAARCVQRVLYL
jgi:hypothetical protein